MATKVVALLKELSAENLPRVTAHGQRVANAHISTIRSELRRILSEGNVFKVWEVDAIIEAVVSSLREDGRLESAKLFTKLHGSSFSKDTSRDLAEALSRHNPL